MEHIGRPSDRLVDISCPISIRKDLRTKDSGHFRSRHTGRIPFPLQECKVAVCRLKNPIFEYVKDLFVLWHNQV